MIEKLRQIIEWQVLELIKGLTEIGKLTQEQAQSIAQHTLECLKPNMAIEEFFKSVFRLDDGFPELSFIVLPIARKYKERIENPSVEYVRSLVHKTRYDEAIAIAKRVVNQDIKIKFVAKGSPAAKEGEK